jgi:GTP-binding protein HflX
MQERALLIDIIELGSDAKEADLRLNELDSLVKTYGGVSVLKVYQKRAKPAYRTYVGEGKIKELLDELGGADGVDVIILNNILKPRQIYNLEEICVNYEIDRLKSQGRFETPRKIKVWDRVDLILKIFDKHAVTAEAKLQIELASIKHMGPRIFGMGLELSRQAGGIGTVGIGETNIEIMKRHLQKRTKLIEEKITNYGEIQRRQRETRRDRNTRTVALAGYTNAGKSTLIKALTKKKDVYIADALFATLDSKVGELFTPPPENQSQTDSYKYYSQKTKFMIADTIGFIQDLPPDLIKAFKTTLAEIVDADLILHVIDVNDINIHLKIRVVEEILDELLGDKKTPKIYVFNKADLIKNKPWQEEDQKKYLDDLCFKYAHFNPHVVSALDPGSLMALINSIAKSQ